MSNSFEIHSKVRLKKGNRFSLAIQIRVVFNLLSDTLFIKLEVIYATRPMDVQVQVFELVNMHISFG